jgi:putative aldouronate transport system substrate-binding protein
MSSKSKLLIATVMTGALLIGGCTKADDAVQPQATDGPSKTPPMELSWFIDGEAGSLLPEKADEDFVKKAIEEKFNVKLKVQSYPAGADYDNKLTVALASGNSPDMFITSGTLSQKLIQDGLIAKMAPFVSKQTMPNYYKYWNTNELEMKSYQVEGDFYRAPLPYKKNLQLAYYIRKDWLDKFSLSVPTTYDQMLAAMRKFTNDDPDGNGKKDTYGFTTNGNGKSLALAFPQWRQNGLYAGYYVENDQFYDTQTDPRVAKVVDDTLKMIEEGLVDPDWFLNKAEQVTDKAVQGKAGIVYSADVNFALDSSPNSVQNKTKALNPKADWVAFNPYPDKPFWTQNEAGYPFLFSKKTADQQPDKIRKTVEILDWLAGEEGFLLTRFGVADKHYTKQGSAITLNKETYLKDVVQKGNFLTIYDFFSPPSPETFNLVIKDPDQTPRDEKILAFIATGYKYVASVGASTTPPAGVNLGEMRNKMSEYHAKMLFEDKSSANWPKYREEIMIKYRAKDIFEAYASQISEARGKKITFNAGN